MENIVIFNFDYMIIEIVKIVAPLVIAAVVRVIEKKRLRKKGILRDEQYYKDDDYLKRY